MKCPKCKKKLQTKRTIELNTEVRREKFCVKCKKSFETWEMSTEAHNKIIEQHKNQYAKLFNDYEKVEQKYIDLKEALHLVIKAGQKK